MIYAFLNNFSQELDADLGESDTILMLDDNGVLLENASADLVYALTLDDGEGTVEIVHVTGASGNELTVERGKEGTVAAQWPLASTVEMRVTAGVMGASAWVQPFQGDASTDGAIALGAGDLSEGIFPAGAHAARAVAIGGGSEAVNPDAGAIGRGSGAYADGAWAFAGATVNGAGSVGFSGDTVVNGAGSVGFSGAGVGGDDAFAHGPSASAGGAKAVAFFGDAYGENAVVLGVGAKAGDDSLAIGPGADAQSSGSLGTGCALGKNTTSAPGTIAVGEDATAQAPMGSAFGKGATSLSPESGAYGPSAVASTPYSIALGPYADTANVAGGFQVNALSYLPAAYDDTGNYAGPPRSATRRASQQVVIATDPLDLTDDTAAVTLDLPANTMLFIDSIDVVVTGSDTPGGSPEITIGPDDVTPAAYLAATPVTKTAVGGRETHSPLVADGVTSLRVATSTAGTGTTYQAKVIFRGYVMEV